MASSTSNKAISKLIKSAFLVCTEAVVIRSFQREPLNASIYTGKSFIQDSSSLSKRELTYGRAVDDGNRYFGLLENPSVTEGQSLFTDETNLSNSGWVRTIARVRTVILENLQSAFNEVEITVVRRDCKCISWEHTQGKMNSAMQWIPATKGRYTNIYNVKAGIIIAQANFGPEFMSTNSVDLVPDVRRWSDIVFVEWQSQAAASNQNLKNLKYVIQHDIINKDTLKIIAMAVGDHSLRWPGVVVPMTGIDGQPNDAGRAILGTPSGVGVAYLLSTHKIKLGHRLIDSVRVWTRKKSRIRYLIAMFEIGEEIPTGQGITRSNSS